MIAFVIGQEKEREATMRSALDHGVRPAAILPVPVEAAERELAAAGLRWTWPLHGTATIANLTCHAYKTRDNRARISCFLAHANAWLLCDRSEEPVAVFEDDALFTRFFDPAELDAYEQYGMISLNDPRGATRQAKRYHFELQHGRCCDDDEHAPRDVIGVPWVDDDSKTPQGLPGHSAYVLQPWFARELLQKVQQLGAMPNDALANRQWFPGKLGCLTRYATKVSGRPSTLA